MNNIDFTPLYRSTIGFDRLASMLDNAMRSEVSPGGYPPYNIEVLEDDHYSITLAVAGFEKDDVDIDVEKGVLTVRGRKGEDKQRNYLYQGIANRAFERKFNLADYVEVTGARLNHGLLTIELVKEIPEAMKPKKIAIQQGTQAIEHKKEQSKETKAA
jgi:molecular chaperone IbpA